jgi:hypothetical protein
MRAYTKTMLTLIVLALIIVALYSFTNWFSKATGYVLGEDEKVKLAQCLTEKKSVLYISATCPNCNKQIKDFSEASKFLTIKQCTSIEECPNIDGFPAWKINNKLHYNIKDLSELIDISKCEVE